MNLLRKIFLVREIKSRGGTLHFRRYRLLACRWFNIYIHRIFKADEDKHCHTHPWDFTSVVLYGGYRELRLIHSDGGPAVHLNSKVRECLVDRRPGEIIRNKAEDAHQLYSLEKASATTLVITGRRIDGKWGYVTEIGFIPHDEYRERKHQGNLLPSVDKQLDDLYDWIDTRFKDGDFALVNDALVRVDIPSTDTDILIGWMTATLPAKNKLEFRTRFIHYVRRDLLDRMEEHEVDQLLKGLS